MKIVLGSDGSIELTRGEHITRGQDKSRQVFVEWAEGVSPIDTGQFLADNMVVEMCITRPDGEQSGWQTAVKVDGDIKYLYILQAWDTAVSGQASLQVRWYDITQEEENRIIEVSNEAFFIVDNGKIAQPLNLSSENYNEIVLQFITPLSTQAFRKYNVNALPDTVAYEPDGAKTAPALFYNFTHEVVDIVPSVLNQGAAYERVKSTCDGFLLVNRKGSLQTEFFFTNKGKIYIRELSNSPASEFKDIIEQYLYVRNHEHKIIFEFVGLDEDTNIILGGSHGEIVIKAPTKTTFTTYEEIKPYLEVGQKIDGLFFEEDGSLGETREAYWEITEINDSGFTVTDNNVTLIVAMNNISDTVTEAGMSSTSVVIDKTLTVEGAGADAKVVGEKFADCVKKTDYATDSKAGIFKTDFKYGTRMSLSHVLFSPSKTDEEYHNRETTSYAAFISKGTLENIKYHYVKRALVDNDIILTDEEKRKIQKWLGLLPNHHSISFSFSSSGSLNNRTGTIWLDAYTSRLLETYDALKPFLLGETIYVSDPSVTLRVTEVTDDNFTLSAIHGTFEETVTIYDITDTIY